MPILTGTAVALVSPPRLWLAVVDGRVRAPGARPAGPVPEMPMQVRFEGLSRDEERRALGAFPGGRRFVLGTEFRK